MSAELAVMCWTQDVWRAGQCPVQCCRTVTGADEGTLQTLGAGSELPRQQYELGEVCRSALSALDR